MSNTGDTWTDVPLNGIGNKSKATMIAQAQTRAAKKKARVNIEQKDNAEKKSKEIEHQINEISTKFDTVKKNLPTFQPMLEAVDADKDAAGGICGTKALLRNDKVLLPDSAFASSMQQLTGDRLTAADIAKSQRNLLDNPSASNGAFGTYKIGNKTAINRKGESVSKNLQIVAKARMDYFIANNISIAKRNNALCHNLKPGIPRAARDHVGVYYLHDDGFGIEETPEGWPEDKHGIFADWAAKLMTFKDIDDMRTKLSSKRSELGGMRYTRIHQGKEINLRKFGNYEGKLINKTAGFKFYFIDGNSYRFEA